MRLITIALFILSISTYSFSQNVGIGTDSPTETLEINGGLKIGTATNTNPGTLQFNSTDSVLEYHDGLQWVGLVLPAYASMGFYHATVGSSYTLTSQGAWYDFFTATDSIISDSSQIIFTGGNAEASPDEFTIQSKGAGTYWVSINASFSGTNLQTYELCLAKNGSAQTNILLRRKLGNGGDVGSASASGIIKLANGDDINVKMRCTSGAGNDINIETLNFSIVRFGK